MLNEETVRILLIEDNPDDATLAQRALEKDGHTVTWAASGDAARAALEEATFDLLLLDYRLPDTTGLDVLARLREEGHTLPVIMVTGENDQRIAAEALKAGAADYIVKEKGYLGALSRTARQVVHTHRLTVARAIHQQLNQALSETLDLPTIYRTLYDCLRQHLDCTNFAVARFNGETRVFTCAFAMSEGEPVAPETFPPRPADFPPLSQVLQSGQPLIIADLLTAPDLEGPRGQRMEAVGPGAPPRSAIYAPMFSQNKPLGVLLLQSPLPHAYRQADAEILLTVASQAAMRIQNADLYTRATRREEQVRLAAEVGREISAILDEPALLGRVVTLIQEQFNLYNVNIFMRVGNKMEFKAGRGGYTGDPPVGVRLPLGQGIIGLATQAGESLNVPDVLQDERYYHYEGLPDVRSELAVPLRLHDHVAGVLDVQSRQPAAFDDIDQLVMQMIADQVGVALQNAHTHRAMTLQSRKLAALNEVIAAAASGQDVQSVLERSLDAALAALSLERGAIFVTDERSTVTHVAVREHTDTFVEQIGASVPRERGFRATIVVENLDEFDSPLGPLLSAEKIGAFIAVPIRVGETIGGGLTGIDSKPRHFTLAEIQLLESVGRQVGVAIERAQVFEAKQAALRREETLRNVLAIASTSLDPHTVLQRVIELVRACLNADWGESHIPLPNGGHRSFFAGVDAATCGLTDTPCLAGVNGVALFDNEVVREEKVSDHPKSIGFPEGHIPIGPFLGVPVRVDGQPVADLLLARAEGREPFTAEDEALLVAIAGQTALALRNARLFEQTNRQVTELDTLYALGLDLSRVLDPEDIPSRIREAVSQVTNTDNLYVALHDEETNTVYFPIYLINGEQLDPLSRPFGNGLTEYVIRTGKPLLLAENIGEEIRRREIDLIGTPCYSLLATPLRVREKTIGVIVLQDYERKNVYNEHHQMLLGAIANQAAIALENARLYQNARQHAAELHALFQVSSALRTATSRQELLAAVVDQTVQVTGAEAGAIFLPDPTGDILRVQEARGILTNLTGLDIPVQGSIAGRIFREDRIFVTDDLSHHPETYPPSAERVGEQARAGISAPLRAGDNTIGVLMVATETSRQFDSQDERIVATIAEMAGSALQRQQYHDEVVVAYEKLRETQAQLVQAEKLSAIGQLVAGVAHEINNPLQGIVGFSELLAMEQTQDNRELTMDYVQRIRHEAERVRRIVQNLLSFARQHGPKRELTSINDLLQRALDLRLYHLRTNNIEVSMDLDPNLPITVMDPYQLQQVFLNLINNAQQAMSDTFRRGHLIVRSRLIGGDTIRVEVEDDGPGIPEEQVGKIFDPFFTTKEVGKGTGLGLSICYGIVQEHKGHIWAESPVHESPAELGPGTRFVVELPLQKSSWAAELLTNEKQAKEVKAEPLRVLIVDDEEMVALFLADVLRTEGHHVRQVDRAEKALNRLNSETYDLIFCDLKMPGLDGRSFYETLAAHDAAQAKRVVFITGDTASPPTRAFLKATGQPFLEKPFSVDTVLKIVERGAWSVERRAWSVERRA